MNIELKFEITKQIIEITTRKYVFDKDFYNFKILLTNLDTNEVKTIKIGCFDYENFIDINKYNIIDIIKYIKSLDIIYYESGYINTNSIEEFIANGGESISNSIVYTNKSLEEILGELYEYFRTFVEYKEQYEMYEYIIDNINKILKG